MSGLGADAGVHVLGDSRAPSCWPAATPACGLHAATSCATLVSIAQRFLEMRGTTRGASQNSRTPSALIDGLPRVRRARRDLAARHAGRRSAGSSQDDGRVALGAGVPLGVLQARVAEYLAAIDAPMVVTPWRSVLVCDLDEGVADTALRVLAPLGLVFDEDSPWLDVSACTGSPGCEHSAADVRADAAARRRRPGTACTGTSSAANEPAAARRPARC